MPPKEMTHQLTISVGLSQLDERILAYAGTAFVFKNYKYLHEVINFNRVWFNILQISLKQVLVISYEDNVDYHKANLSWNGSTGRVIMRLGKINLGSNTHNYLIKVNEGPIKYKDALKIIGSTSSISVIKPLIVNMLTSTEYMAENPQTTRKNYEYEIGHCIFKQLRHENIEIFNAIYDASLIIYPDFNKSPGVLTTSISYAIHENDIELVGILINKIPLELRNKKFINSLKHSRIGSIEMTNYLIGKCPTIKDSILEVAINSAVIMGNIKLIKQLQTLYGIEIPLLGEADTHLRYHVNTLKLLVNDNIITHDIEDYLYDCIDNNGEYDTNGAEDAINYLLGILTKQGVDTDEVLQTALLSVVVDDNGMPKYDDSSTKDMLEEILDLVHKKYIPSVDTYYAIYEQLMEFSHRGIGKRHDYARTIKLLAEYGVDIEENGSGSDNEYDSD